MPEHTNKLTEDQRYCANLARRYDEDWYLAVGFAEEGIRPALYVLQAFFAEVSRIPASVTEPPLGEIRLQWWRDALGEVYGETPVRAHPVVKALAETQPVSETHSLRKMLDDVIDATGFLMTATPFKDFSHATVFFENTYGRSLEALALILSSGEVADTVRHALKTAGGSFALVRHLAIATGDPASSRQVPLAADRLAALQQTDVVEFQNNLTDRLREDRAALKGLDPTIMSTAAHLGLMRPLWLKCLKRSDPKWPAALSPLKKRFTLTKTVMTGRF